MFRRLGRVLGFPLRLWSRSRRHPGLAVMLVAVGVLAAGLGVWGYALWQWKAAQTAVAEDRPGEALERLAICLKLWPRDPEVHFLAGRASRMTGDFSAAEFHLNQCLEYSPDEEMRGRVQVEFALIRVQTGEVDELAEALFNKVAELEQVQAGHPESAVILQTVASSYLQRLRYKPAYACLSRWIEIQPNNPKAYHWRGWALERLNNPKAAMDDYNRALELDPNLLPVRLRVAEMLLEDKQAPEALPHLERLYQQAPDNPEVQARLGMCRFLEGRAQEARQLMEAAVVHLPNDPALLVTLANLDLQQGRIPDAERRLRSVLASDPSDTEALFVLVPVLQAQGRTKEAEAALAEFQRKRAVVDRINDLLKDVADSPTAKASDYAEIGELFLEIEREKFGIYWSERALEKDPENQRAHKALAAYYQKKGESAKAALHRQHIRPPQP